MFRRATPAPWIQGAGVARRNISAVRDSQNVWDLASLREVCADSAKKSVCAFCALTGRTLPWIALIPKCHVRLAPNPYGHERDTVP